MTPPRGGAQPWLGIAMLLIAQVLLISTAVLDEARTFPRFILVVLWVITAVAAMLKERMAYGLGDRVTLFGAVLIFAVTIAAAVFDRGCRGGLCTLSAFSVAAATIMLVKVFMNVLARLNAVID